MFEAIAKLVESNGISKEAAEALNKEVSAKLAELRDEAKKYRIEKEELAKSFDDVKAARDELAEKMKDIDEKINAARNEGKSELVAELEKERTEKAKLHDDLSRFEQENTKLKITNAVNSELGKYKVKSDLRTDAEMVLSSLTKVTENGLVFGEEGIALEEGVKQYFDSRKSYLEPEGTPGSGSGNQGGSGGNAPKNMGGSREERVAAIKDMIKG